MILGALTILTAVLAIAGVVWLGHRGRVDWSVSVGAMLLTLAIFPLVADLGRGGEAASAVIFFLGLASYGYGLIRQGESVFAVGGSSDQLARVHALSDIMHIAATRENLYELLGYSLDRFLEVFGITSGAIHVYHRQKGLLVLGAYRGISPSYASRLELLQPGQTSIGRTLQTKRALIIRDLSVSPDYEFFGGRAGGYSFLAVAPILVDHECWGVVTFLGRQKYHRGMIDVSLLEQSGQKLGQALQIGRQNRQAMIAAQKNERLLEYYETLIETLTTSPHDKFLSASLANCSYLLFEGRPFVVIFRFGDGWKAIRSVGNRAFAELAVTFQAWEILAGPRPAGPDKEVLFSLSAREAKRFGIFDDFREDQVGAVGFWVADRLLGLVVVGASLGVVKDRYLNDLRLLRNLILLNEVAAAAKLPIWTFEPAGYGKTAAEMAVVLTAATGHLQLLRRELSAAGAEHATSSLLRRLEMLNQELAKGMSLLEEMRQQDDPNLVIESVLRNSDVDCEFHRGLSLPSMGTRAEDLRDLVGEVVKAASQTKRRITLSTGASDGRLVLTVGGVEQDDALFESLRHRAELMRVELRFVTQVAEDSSPHAAVSAPEPVFETLIVEDREAIRQLLVDYFGNLGRRCKAVGSAAEALSVVKQLVASGKTVRTAIVDASLSDMSGPRLCRLLKEIDARMRTALLLGWGASADREMLREAGVDVVVQKPFRLEQLHDAIFQQPAGDSAVGS